MDGRTFGRTDVKTVYPPQTKFAGVIIKKLGNRAHIKIKSKVGEQYLSYDVKSGSEITPCTKIDDPLVVNRFWGNL